MSYARTFYVLLAAVSATTCWAGSAAQQAMQELMTEREGSPYHWVGDKAEGGMAYERVLLGKPGRTAADEKLKADILKSIGGAEEKAGGPAAPNVIEVRLMPKANAGYNEIWVVSRDGKKIAYTVAMSASPQGGVDFRLSGPWE
jgi:hypothetical protein